MKQINIFIEMAICMAVDCKSDIGQGKAEVFINFQETKIRNSNAGDNTEKIWVYRFFAK